LLNRNLNRFKLFSGAKHNPNVKRVTEFLRLILTKIYFEENNLTRGTNPEKIGFLDLIGPEFIKRTFQTQTNTIMAGFISVFNAFFKAF
jgi:hypothetical protein